MPSRDQQRLRLAQDIDKVLGKKFGEKLDLLDRGSTKALSAWFLGPKAENQEAMARMLDKAFRMHCADRLLYVPDDPVHVTQTVKDSDDYKTTLADCEQHLDTLLEMLRGSIPLSSYRNQSHMYWDITLPGFVGYVAAMLYNQNNVAAEASPITTWLELEVGRDLCRMLGYTVPDRDDKTAEIVPWGHITCDGSVANSEAMWAARNLKYFPIAVAHALEHSALKPARNMRVTLPGGEREALRKLSTWQLLNLGVDEILRLSPRIVEYGVTSSELDKVLEDYTLQNLGLAEFSTRFLGDHEYAARPVVLAPATAHYSWPKSATLLGLGKHSLIPVETDLDCKMDMGHLRTLLDECVARQQPVLQVVAVIGTTEESAVDPLDEICEIRNEYRRDSLEFSLHLDAAWGGYFASMLHKDPDAAEDERTPTAHLCPKVLSAYEHFPHADTITVDPHKSGFIPYPAGALCYRNGSMRDMIRFTAPVVYHGGVDPTVGVYGIEGSKPGAAATAVYLSHRVLRTNASGYGKLLGKCIWNSKRLYAALITMAKPNDRFIVEPVQRLPAYREGAAKKWPKNKIEAEAERQRARLDACVVRKKNSDIEQDAETMELFKKIGSDQNIIAYSFNFKHADGTLNTDLDLANQLNDKIYRRLSMKIQEFEPGKVPDEPMFVTASEFTTAINGDKFVDNYMARLGLTKRRRKAPASVKFLISTTQNPWLTDVEVSDKYPDGNFIPTLIQVLRNTVNASIRELEREIPSRKPRPKRRGGAAASGG